ncbi:hypothetical protein MDAP_001771 [Mitosporidium daphniae]
MLGSISEISIKVPWYSPFKQPVNVFVDGLALHFKLKDDYMVMSDLKKEIFLFFHKHFQAEAEATGNSYVKSLKSKILDSCNLFIKNAQVVVERNSRKFAFKISSLSILSISDALEAPAGEPIETPARDSIDISTGSPVEISSLDAVDVCTGKPVEISTLHAVEVSPPVNVGPKSTLRILSIESFTCSFNAGNLDAEMATFVDASVLSVKVTPKSAGEDSKISVDLLMDSISIELSLELVQAYQKV